ncbi:MAG: hypothetical protein D6729_10555 [Deltaproteobacteria bacterium]|nr:MAG: hypothetical protein D6729_10555 [Deltaproteobacteria bacterium]
MLDLDPTEGHPCAVDGGPACLPGYACIDGICQRAGDGVKTCPAECPAGQKCDLRVGKCADLCAASVCETGQGCHAGEACAPIGSGVGRSCSVDSDCAGAIPGCSTDPAAPAAVHCVCAVPLSGATGLCLGIPAVAQDCAACGETACIPVPFSGAGPGVVCAPGGFRGCEGPVDCADPETDLECTLFAWPADPGWRQPGEPEGGVQALGYFSACASKGEAAEKAVGEGCDPALLTCRTGLCLLDGTGAGLCTRACGADGACAGVSEGRCVAAPVASVLDGRQTFDVARVCGAGPTLGAACDADPGVCGNDAPLCAPHPDLGSKYCTRACVDDGDCDAARGFRCRPGVWQCF